MTVWLGLLLLAATSAIVVAVLYATGKVFVKREPYRAFTRLPARQKMRFFRLLLRDQRVPRAAKALPLVLVLYLASPIDIIPDFIPVLGFLDDVAIALGTLALAVRLTPRAVIDDLLRAASEAS